MASPLAHPKAATRPALRPVLRPVGKPAGSYVSGDLAEKRKTIQLCSGCRNRFDWKRNGYVMTLSRWGFVVGPCDGCRTPGSDNVGFIHESRVADPGGRVSSGREFVPR